MSTSNHNPLLHLLLGTSIIRASKKARKNVLFYYVGHEPEAPTLAHDVDLEELKLSTRRTGV